LLRAAKSKKQRRIAAKKQKAFEEQILATGDLTALAPKIPLQHQTINLPDGGAGTLEEVRFAAAKRLEVKKAMRKERKDKNRESNFLKTM
jgi:large subunit ribosomal protein L54